MFANTLTLVVNSVDKVLERINQDNFGSEYRYIAADGSEKIKMTFRHATDTQKIGSVDRHTVYVEWTKPATPTEAAKYWSVSWTLRSLDGSSPATLVHLSAALSVLMGFLDDGFVLGVN